ERLDPTQVYMAQSTGRNGYQKTKGGDRTTIDPPGVPQVGDDDVNGPDHQPWWGILSPLIPWSGPGNTSQSVTTGIIKNTNSVRPWAPPDNLQAFKDSRDATVVKPPKYA